MHKLHFHTIEPIYASENPCEDIVTAIYRDFTTGTFNQQDDDFWFGVSVDRYLELSDDVLEILRKSVSDMLSDIPTIWAAKSVTRDKPTRLIFLVGVRGILGR